MRSCGAPAARGRLSLPLATRRQAGRLLVAALALAAGACAIEASEPVSLQQPVSPQQAQEALPTPTVSAAPTATPTPEPTPASATLLPTSTPPPTATPEPERVMTGAEVLVAEDFARLRGQRVGLITGSVVPPDGVALIDRLAEHGDVTLVAAFAPEHGLRGDRDAGATFAAEVDPKTGVPVFSLYGTSRSPSPDALADIDVLVYDLQDVGTRFYTYISTLGLAMQAAADADVTFMVLDRPNPQGGGPSAGFVTEAGFESFISQYPLPALYGLTAGELATMIVGEGWLGDLSALDLRVVELVGWDRSTRAHQDDPWVPPSPGLPTVRSALVYPGTVLFEATELSVARGTDEAFARIGAPWIDGAVLAASLNERGLAGVAFESIDWTPAPAPVGTPRFLGSPVGGVRVVITDERFAPVDVGVHLLAAVRDHAAKSAAPWGIDRPDHLDLLAGTDRLRLALQSGATAEEIIAEWSAEAAAFDQLRSQYERY